MTRQDKRRQDPRRPPAWKLSSGHEKSIPGYEKSMPEQENKSPDPPGPSPTTKISRKGRKIEFYGRKIEFEHENSTPEHEKSIPEHENGSPEPPAPSPTTKNPENGPKTSKNPKNRKFGVGGRREAPSIHSRYIRDSLSSVILWKSNMPLTARVSKRNNIMLPSVWPPINIHRFSCLTAL